MFLDLLSMDNKNAKYADLLFIDNKITKNAILLFINNKKNKDLWISAVLSKKDLWISAVLSKKDLWISANMHIFVAQNQIVRVYGIQEKIIRQNAAMETALARQVCVTNRGCKTCRQIDVGRRVRKEGVQIIHFDRLHQDLKKNSGVI